MITLIFLSTNAQASSVEDVWHQVTMDGYTKLPKNSISFKSLFGWGKSKIKQAAKRTLNSKKDILPQFRKLAHPNGVCLKGQWEITKANKYSGYFKYPSIAPIIVRASTAMSATKKGKNRAFGFAGKIFPVGELEGVAPTANFVLVDDLGGTKAAHYTDVEMTNEPDVSKTSAVIKNILYVLKLAATFGKADNNPGMRQVYEISELGETDLTKVVTPKWMMVKAQAGQTVDENDFRNELNIENYDDKLTFDIYVADFEVDGKKNWSKVGEINFTDSIASNSCDHRLHFHHPKWK